LDKFDIDAISHHSTLRLTPNLVGPSIVHNEGIVGEGVTLTLSI
jgi:hypothetical protein